MQSVLPTTDPGELRSAFLRTGWSSITSDSIVQDCGVLLGDVFYLANSLSLIEASESEVEAVARVTRQFHDGRGDADALSVLSRLVGQALFLQARSGRAKVAAIYDMVKHLQSFHALLQNAGLQRRVRHLLGAHTLFIHKDSVGVRIDVPMENEQLTDLHQEFHSFPFGVNGLVVWIPLTTTDLAHGTVGFYPRSHLAAPLAFAGDAKAQQRLNDQGRYQEAQKLGALQVEPHDLGPQSHIAAEPGHCYLFSAVLPHVSIPASPSADIARITCQARLFDVDDKFLQWKHRTGRFWEGLKKPTVSAQLWKEFSGG